MDLGAAPGGWSQYAAARTGKGGRVVAVDRLAFDPVVGVEQVIGDATDPGIREKMIARLEGGLADLVLSDMAPNLTGNASIDQANAIALADIALSFAVENLQPRGKMLVKVFEGGELTAFRRRCERHFTEVKLIKPKASRANSREIYLLADYPIGREILSST